MARLVPNPGLLFRWLGSSALLAVSALIVFHLRIGDVVASITPAHGIHAGDPLALVPFAVAVALLDPRAAPRGSQPRRFAPRRAARWPTRAR